MDSSEETSSSEGLYAEPLSELCWGEVNVFLAFFLCSLAFAAFLGGRGIIEDLWELAVSRNIMENSDSEVLFYFFPIKIWDFV